MPKKDPNITQDDLKDAREKVDINFVEVLTNEDLEKLLNEPPGLLYGDYYLRLNYIEVSQATLSAFNEDIAEGRRII